MAHKDHMFEVLYATYEDSYKDYDENNQGVNKNRIIEIEEFFSEKTMEKFLKLKKIELMNNIN